MKIKDLFFSPYNEKLGGDPAPGKRNLAITFAAISALIILGGVLLKFNALRSVINIVSHKHAATWSHYWTALNPKVQRNVEDCIFSAAYVLALGSFLLGEKYEDKKNELENPVESDKQYEPKINLHVYDGT